MHRAVGAHRVDDGQEVVGQLLQGEPAPQWLRGRRSAVATDVVQHHVEMLSQAGGDLGPHLLGVRIAVHEHHRGPRPIAQLGDTQLDPTCPHPALARAFESHESHFSFVQRRTVRVRNVTLANVTVVRGCVNRLARHPWTTGPMWTNPRRLFDFRGTPTGPYDWSRTRIQLRGLTTGVACATTFDNVTCYCDRKPEQAVPTGDRS